MFTQLKERVANAIPLEWDEYDKVLQELPSMKAQIQRNTEMSTLALQTAQESKQIALSALETGIENKERHDKAEKDMFHALKRIDDLEWVSKWGKCKWILIVCITILMCHILLHTILGIY